MKKLERLCCYMHLDTAERKIFDEKRAEYQYKTRTDMLTSMIRMVIYNQYENAPDGLVPTMACFQELDQTSKLIRRTLYGILDEHGYAVLAMRGADVGCQLLMEDLKKWMYEKIHLVPDDDYIRYLVHVYCDIHHTEFVHYRYEQKTKNFEEELGLDQNPTAS